MEASIEHRLAAVEETLSALVERLDDLESLVGYSSSVAEPTPVSAAEPPAAPTAVDEAPPTPAAEPAAPTPTRRQKAIRPGETFEDLLGGRVLAWVGGLAIFVGVIFFLAIAIDRGWIGVEARVALAFLGATALLIVGLVLHERRGELEAAVAAVATALAALYASLTYATAVEHVISDESGLVVATMVGIVGAAIAVRWRSQFVAALALLGALAAPVLVSSGTSTLSLAFMVIALCSTVAVLIWQRWGWLGAGAFLISAPQLAAWAFDVDDLALALAVLGLNWALFVVAAIGYELRVPTSKLRVSSASLLLLNAAFTSAVGWFVIDDLGSSEGGTAWVLGVTVGHIVLGAFGFRQRMSAEIAALLVAVGLGLSGVTLALALDGPALVAGWSAEAAILAWVARRTGEQRAWIFSCAFLVLALFHTITVEAIPEALLEGVPDLGQALVAVLCVGVAALVMAHFAAGSDLRMFLVALAGVAFLYAASLAIVDVIQGDAEERSQTAQVALSAFWALVGLAAIVAGLARDLKELRLAGLALLGLGVAKVFVYDLAELDQLYRVLSLVAIGLVLLAGAYAYQRIRAAGRMS